MEGGYSSAVSTTIPQVDHQAFRPQSNVGKKWILFKTRQTRPSPKTKCKLFNTKPSRRTQFRRGGNTFKSQCPVASWDISSLRPGGPYYLVQTFRGGDQSWSEKWSNCWMLFSSDFSRDHARLGGGGGVSWWQERRHRYCDYLCVCNHWWRRGQRVSGWKTKGKSL